MNSLSSRSSLYLTPFTQFVGLILSTEPSASQGFANAMKMVSCQRDASGMGTSFQLRRPCRGERGETLWGEPTSLFNGGDDA
eukprot:scaffold4185_cov163-Alexandrium_tamarense.AAC.7